MTEQNISTYLNLAGRRLFIVMHSGRDWKPEYGPELEAIDRELAGFEGLIAREMQKGVKERWCAQR